MRSSISTAVAIRLDRLRSELDSFAAPRAGPGGTAANLATTALTWLASYRGQLSRSQPSPDRSTRRKRVLPCAILFGVVGAALVFKVAPHLMRSRVADTRR